MKTYVYLFWCPHCDRIQRIENQYETEPPNYSQSSIHVFDCQHVECLRKFLVDFSRVTYERVEWVNGDVSWNVSGSENGEVSRSVSGYEVIIRTYGTRM